MVHERLGFVILHSDNTAASPAADKVTKATFDPLLQN